MAVTIDDVRHIAALARLGLDDARAALLVHEMNTILGHIDALSRVDTSRVDVAIGADAGGLPLRDDGGLPIPMARALDAVAPAMRDGFLVVPRLATHESLDEGEG